MITDLHANLEATEAVLGDIEKYEISDIISLGDNVGYGPNPVEVLLRLYEKDVVTLEGNHDLAVVNPKSFAEATDLALEALEWTRLQLMESLKRDPDFEELLESYLGTPNMIVLPNDERIILVHGAPGDPPQYFNYLLKPEDLLAASKYMRQQGHSLCFFGHTHCQVLWEVDSTGISLIDFIIDEPITYTEEELSQVQIYINPGSVGQPRDQNPDAAYVIYEANEDHHTFTFKRVSYEVEKTRQKIHAVPALDNRLGDRLVAGM